MQMVEGGGSGSCAIAVQSKAVFYEEIDKDLCPSLIDLFLENINRGSRNYRSQKLIPTLNDRHRKGRFSSPATAFILEHLVRVSF